MHWFERKIRRYEHRRWTTDDNRRVQPFHWGLEHIGGSTDDPNPGAFVRQYAQNAIESSREWYAAAPATDYRLDRNNVLTFTSSVESPWPENNTVHAQLFPARYWRKRETLGVGASAPTFRSADRRALAPEEMSLRSNPSQGPAVLLLPNWNAKWHGQNGLCHWIQRMGITVLKLSMPYHDRRMAHGHERADQICGPNIGLTLQANRQAVQDARRCLTWLEQQGYTKLGILGTSLGSSVGYITLAHDDRIRAGGFFHVSTYYADVISQGMTTNHVWEGLRNHVTVDELREYWAPISPMPYVERGMGAGRNTFMLYGKYDPTMLPELTRQMLDSLRRHGADPRVLELPCGHYSLELAPFSYIAGYRMLTFFLESLA
jgi:prolyl oligopeptidase family protein